MGQWIRDIGSSVSRYIAEGNLEAAEYICRQAIADENGDKTAALLGLAIIARRLWRFEHEHVFLDKLARPFATRYRAELPPGHIAVGATTPADGRSRYLIINAWGEGFWSDVSHVIGCCVLAWLSNRIPITNWRQGSLYTDDPARDGFVEFFEPLSSHSLETIPLEGATIFPDRWTAEMLRGQSSTPSPHRSSGPSLHEIMMSGADVVVCDRYISPAAALNWIIPTTTPGKQELTAQLGNLLARCCRPKRKWQSAADRFIAQTFGEEPFLAFHLRGTDKRDEHAESLSVATKVVQTAALSCDYGSMLLLTDDTDCLIAMQARFGEKLKWRNVVRAAGSLGTHRAELPLHRDKAISRVRLGGEVLSDALIAAKSRIFVGDGESNVAAAISLMADHRKTDVKLVSDNQLLEWRDWGLIRW